MRRHAASDTKKNANSPVLGKTLGKGKIPEKKEERAEKDEQPSIVNKNFKKVPEI